MKPYDFIKQSKIADPNGFVDVNKETMQHKKYSNIFALGDCSNIPTSKTAAAVAAQSNILYTNLKNVMNGKPTNPAYDGYTSCPCTVDLIRKRKFIFYFISFFNFSDYWPWKSNFS